MKLADQLGLTESSREYECRFRAFKECMDFWFGPHDGSEPDCLVYSPLLKLRRDRQERSLLNPWR